MLKATVSKQKQDRDRLLSLPYVNEPRKKTLKNGCLRSHKGHLGPRRAVNLFCLDASQSAFAYFNFDDESSLEKKRLILTSLSELKQVYGDSKFILFDEMNLPN